MNHDESSRWNILRPVRRATFRTSTLVTFLAASLAFASCGGEETDTRDLSEGAALAARLPSDGALNIAIADVDAIRSSIGMKPGTAPPTQSDEDDLTFLAETAPALGILGTGDVPPPVVDAALERASSIASVTGDRAATAISAQSDETFEGLLRATGLRENDAAFVAENDAYAVAIGDGVIAIAEDGGAARSIIEETGDDLPDPLMQIEGDGELVTLARFGASCLDWVATSDSVGATGEVAFFTNASPDPERIETTGLPPGKPRIVGDSARVEVPAARGPSEEPPALLALIDHLVDYDCDAS